MFGILECQPVGLVFGIPLTKCIANDIELRKRKASAKDRTNEGDIVINRRDQRYEEWIKSFLHYTVKPVLRDHIWDQEKVIF